MRRERPHPPCSARSSSSTARSVSSSSALKQAHLLDSTTIIVTAKHGQSPIDTHRFFPIPGSSGANGTPPSAVLGSNFLPDSELNQIGATEDDISLLWLKPGTSTTDAVSLLETNAKAAGIGEILYGPSLETTSTNRAFRPRAAIPARPTSSCCRTLASSTREAPRSSRNTAALRPTIPTSCCWSRTRNPRAFQSPPSSRRPRSRRRSSKSSAWIRAAWMPSARKERRSCRDWKTPTEDSHFATPRLISPSVIV